jgi:nucleoside-diphosphate-sugar epimerase
VLRAHLEEEYEVAGLDKRGPFSPQVREVDIRDASQVKEALRSAAPLQALLHLAADPRNDAPWEAVLPNNIIGTRNVFEAARETGVERVVFASSNHVTGAYEGFKPDRHLHREHEPPLISVRDPIRPDGYYGVSKAFGEALARYFAAQYGISFICLRIGAVLVDDDPTANPRYMRVWLSHRDLVQLVKRSLAATHIPFGVYYGVSKNRGAFWDISDARWDLGYDPQDDASKVEPRRARD